MSTSFQDEKMDPRVKRTRGLIQQAFLQLFSEKEFQSITVQDITQKAEINRATFYAHYPDKFALLEASIRQIFHQELEKHTLNACKYSEQNLRALISTVCEFISWANSHCQDVDGQFEMLIEKQVRIQIQELLELWSTESISNVDQNLAVIAASWAIYGLALQWKVGKSTLSAEDYADRILPLIVVNLHFKEAGHAVSVAA
jgi:AcrR family transcriptional regulator